MHCLSTKLPWAMLIVAGRKTIEVRNWSGIGRARALIGERVAIHCGRSIAEDAPVDVRGLAFEVSGAWQALRGAIIGSAVVTDAFWFTTKTFVERQPEHLNPLEWWEDGLCGIEFGEPRRLDRPIPWRGELGFFELPEAVGKRLG
jgi:hypothetical protein